MMRPGLSIALVLTASWAPSRASHAAEAVRLTAVNWNLVPSGKEVDAIYGDYLLRNDKVVAVVGDVAPNRRANITLRSVQGAVLDFTLLSTNDDELGAFMPHGKPSGAAANEAEIVNDRGREVRLRVRHTPTEKQPVEAVTEYVLHDGDTFLRVETHYRNTAAKPVRARLSDHVRADETFAQSEAGTMDVVHFYDKWFPAAYAVVRAPRGGQMATNGKGATRDRAGVWVDYPDLIDDVATSTILLAPGRAVALTRYLVAGRHTADVQATAERLLARRSPKLTIAVVDERGHPVQGADVTVTRESHAASAAYTDARGRAELLLPAGTYKVAVEQMGRKRVEETIALRRDAARKVRLGARAEVALDVTDAGGNPIPCKVQFIGAGGTPDPDLGPIMRENGCKNLYFSANGTFTTGIPAGSYRVAISRGPEYDAVFRDVAVEPGRITRVAARLVRVVDSRGWVSADFHNHSSDSGDTTSSQNGRLIAIAAEGVEFAACTEHNRIQTYRPRIKALGLEKFLATSDGIELSGMPVAVAHQNAFPLKIKEHTQGNGSPLTSNDPALHLRALIEHDDRSEKLVQQNHPDIGWLFYDKDGNGVRDQGFLTFELTHAMEVWTNEILRSIEIVSMKPTRPTHSRASLEENNVMFNWLQLLNQGIRIPGVANTDAHQFFHESGAVRNYVKCSTDIAGEIRELEIVRETKRGHVIMTNGPFMDVSFEGGLPGDTILRPTKSGTLRVRVEAPNWLDVDRVQVVVNGRFDPTLNFTRKTHPELFSDAVVKFNHDIPIRIAGDAHLIVIAAGEHASTSPIMGPQGKIPVAISNPIYVDVDGGGAKPNGDTLGAPLPVRSPSAW